MIFHHLVMMIESHMSLKGWNRNLIETFLDEFNEAIDAITMVKLTEALDVAINYAESKQAYFLMDIIVIRDYRITMLEGGLDYSIKKSHKYKDKSGVYFVVPDTPKKTNFNDMAQRLKNARTPQSLKEGSFRSPNNYLTKNLEKEVNQTQGSATRDEDGSFKSISIDDKIKMEQELFVFLQQLNSKIEQDIQSEVRSLVDDSIRRIERIQG